MAEKESPPTHTGRTRHTVVHKVTYFPMSTPGAKLPACVAGNGFPYIRSNRTRRTVVHKVTYFAISTISAKLPGYMAGNGSLSPPSTQTGKDTFKVQ